MVDKLNNTGRFFVAKNRNGLDGLIIPLKVNMTVGTIVIQDENIDIQPANPTELQNAFNKEVPTAHLKNRLQAIKDGNV